MSRIFGRKPGYLYFLIIAALVILQTTLFRYINIKGVNPDIVLIFLVFSAHFRGPLEGQLAGFMAGILEDCLGLAPFGFNTLIRTILGFTAGHTRGKIYFDPVFMPLLAILLASLAKQVLALLTSWLFLKTTAGIFNVGYWIELGITLALTPVFFNVFRLLGLFVESSRNKI